MRRHHRSYWLKLAITLGAIIVFGVLAIGFGLYHHIWFNILSCAILGWLTTFWIFPDADESKPGIQKGFWR
ncbi:hypothetical protein [Schleiferilactobacillus shenzhenensis]|uniref:hypothetical protein n=1 Tax=Schleiferilactobacillus shenzhenensis TaxID=1231337 RepID=UPI00058BD375|nr:hypothetical protein [Schleiferilactobacillus shenzhenensis]